MNRVQIIYNTGNATSIARLMERLAESLGGPAHCSLHHYDIKAGYWAKIRHFLTPRPRIWRDTLRAQVLVIHTSVVYSLAQIMLAKLTGAKIVVFMWDIYPDSYIAYRTRKFRTLFRVYAFLERRLLKSADVVLLPSKDYAPVAEKIGIKHPALFPVWPFTEPLRPDTKRKDPDALHIGFAGAVNVLRGLPEAITRLGAIRHTNIVLHIWSADTFDVAALAPMKNLRIIVHGFVDQSALIQQIRGLDAGLACLSAEFDQPAFPSKIISYISSGIPVIYCGPELAAVSAFLEEFGVGVSLPAQGEMNLEAALLAVTTDFPEHQQAALAYLALTDEKLAHFQ